MAAKKERGFTRYQIDTPFYDADGFYHQKGVRRFSDDIPKAKGWVEVPHDTDVTDDSAGVPEQAMALSELIGSTAAESQAMRAENAALKERLAAIEAQLSGSADKETGE